MWILAIAILSPVLSLSIVAMLMHLKLVELEQSNKRLRHVMQRDQDIRQRIAVETYREFKRLQDKLRQKIIQPKMDSWEAYMEK